MTVLYVFILTMLIFTLINSVSCICDLVHSFIVSVVSEKKHSFKNRFIFNMQIVKQDYIVSNRYNLLAWRDFIFNYNSITYVKYVIITGFFKWKYFFNIFINFFHIIIKIYIHLSKIFALLVSLVSPLFSSAGRTFIRITSVRDNKITKGSHGLARGFCVTRGCVCKIHVYTAVREIFLFRHSYIARDGISKFLSYILLNVSI